MDEATLIDRVFRFIESHGITGGLLVFAILMLLFPDRARVIMSEIKTLRRPVKDVDLTIRRINQCINIVLAELLKKYDADRAYVFEFETYDERVKPLPWLYCSCTYEACQEGRGVNCEAGTLQRVPMDAIPYWKVQLGTFRKICLHSVDEIKATDVESWKILVRQQISSVYCVSLLDFRGLPIGFLGLDYCNGHKSMLTNDCDFSDFAMDVAMVGGLLAMKRNGSLKKLAGTL
jgi:hypothetical protein